MNIEHKHTSSDKDKRGQFMTPPDTITNYMDHFDVIGDLIVEPSFGSGNFLNYLTDRYPDHKVVGCELDDELFNNYDNQSSLEVFNENFYDWEYDFSDYESVSFIGNPPYRTPAESLSTHKSIVKQLLNKYNITGIKEEAVLFFLKTYDMLSTTKDFEIIYILPKTIFQNQSTHFESFRSFLFDNLNLTSVYNLGNEFDNVYQDLVLVSFNNKQQTEVIQIDGIDTPLTSFYGVDDIYYDYREIFIPKSTHLGSVPMESIFFSVKGEPVTNFQTRLYEIFFGNTSNINDNLKWNGAYHLKSLSSKDPSIVKNKLNAIHEYIHDIKSNNLLTKHDILDINNFKPIVNRHHTIYYFRLETLKKQRGVYILNPNPCESFYFTSNPTKTSTDYCGYCEYDVNRNCTPGSIRTIPIEGFTTKISPMFKTLMKSAGLHEDDLLEYMKFIYTTDWYKMMKSKYTRFYFGVPSVFLVDEFYKR